jgi:hypothetical protein
MNPNERMTIDKIYALPPDLQQQILAFAEFVEHRSKSQPKTKALEPGNVHIDNKRNGFGLWQGAITIRDDFDNPLSELEEYME